MKTSSLLLWGLLGGVGIYLYTKMKKTDKPCGCNDVTAPQEQAVQPKAVVGVQDRLIQGVDIALTEVQDLVSR